MKIVIVIPARLESTRLPEKPLIDLNGKSMIQRTYEQCIKAISSDLVFVATDDEKIFKHCENLNIQVVLTSKNCLTGTDRVAEFAKIHTADYYINVQGDEPLINPEDIKEVIRTVKKNTGEVINGYASIDKNDHYRSLSIPKVVFRPDGRLLYMSRSSIPGNKNNEYSMAWRQICIYGFPKDSLMEFSNQNNKTVLENEEDIEILRFLELGYEVRMVELSKSSISVDTLNDVDEVLKKIKKNDLKGI